MLGKLNRSARNQEMRISLTSLAREEMGHARLSAEVVRWCIAEGGAPVEVALRVVRRRYASMVHEADGHAGTMRKYGVPDDALGAEALRGAHRWTEAVLVRFTTESRAPRALFR